MSKAHINSRLSLSDVIIPVDSNTVGLWHFDKHLESTSGIQPVWNVCRLETGKYNNGVTVHEDIEGILSYQMLPPLTITCYFKLVTTETRPDVGDDRVILWYAKVDGNGNYFDDVSSWQVYIPGGGNILRFQCVNAQQSLAIKTLDITNGDVNIYDSNWHYMCIRFNGTNIEFMVDNVIKSIASNQWSTPPVFAEQKIGIGCDPQGFSRAANVCVDELRCDSIYISTEEINAWRICDKPFYDPYDYSVVESTIMTEITFGGFEALSAEQQELLTWNQIENMG